MKRTPIPRRSAAAIGLAAALGLGSAFPATPLEVWLSDQHNPLELVAAAIESAESRVDAVVYKFSDDEMKRVVETALTRGIAVRLVVDATEAAKKKSHVDSAEKAGAKVRRWRQGELHAKLVILDDRRVVTGSFNWTRSARSKNLELVLETDDPASVKKFRDHFEALWRRADGGDATLSALPPNAPPAPTPLADPPDDSPLTGPPGWELAR